MKVKNVVSSLLAVIIIALLLGGSVSTDETVQYTITYTKGYYFHDSLTGKEATGIFRGSLPDDLTVDEGGSFTLPENKLIFRDYVFSGWKYSYKDEDGKTVSVIYQPGDVVEDVACDMSFAAVWKRFTPVEMIITGYLSFKSDEPYYEGELSQPMSVTYKKEIKLPKQNVTMDGHDFKGWVDSDGEFYADGGSYLVNKYNPVLTAVWTIKGGAVLTHQISYGKGAEDAVGEAPRTHNLYETNTFKVSDNTFERENYRFLCWVDEQGNKYTPGKVYEVDSSITLTASWEYITQYYAVDITYNEGGLVSEIPTEVAEQTTIELFITPNTEYKIKNITINGQSVAIAEYFSFVVIEDISVNVEFAPLEKYFITLDQTIGGVIALDLDRDFVYENEVLTGAIVTQEGFVFQGFLVNGSSHTVENNAFSIDDIQGDITLSAIFEKIEQSETESNEVSQPSGEENSKYIVFLAVVVLLLVCGGALFLLKR